MNEQNKRYSNQQSNTSFQPQSHRQLGFDQVNPGRTEIHSSSAPTSPNAPQPAVGVIDQGFGTGEHGAEVVNTIAESNPQSAAWLGGGVGKGNWANSLNQFVDTAKSLGQKAVANLSFDLTEKRPDGSVTTRSQLTKAEQQALSYAHDNGILVVASSGNQGGAMSALGQASKQFDNIIAVGAAEGNDRASYSNFGTGLDLVAPGREAGNAFAGTSRSAAEVTGTVSQMWTANPTLDYRQVTGVLEATATDLQKPGWDAETGAGLLNSRAAVNLAEAITPETQLFSGAQLMQQVNRSFNQSPWTSVDGSVASERTTREFEGESVQEDERLKANYRAQTQAKQQLPAQTTPLKPPVSKEKPLSRFDKAEAANIRREDRVAAERQRLAKEKAALIQVANNPGISLSDRSEAREILRQQEAAAKPHEKPKEPAKPPAPKKTGWLDQYVVDPFKKAGDELEQAASAAKEVATDVGDWAKRNKDVISEVGHTVLDVGGMIPVVGAVADGINAGWYAAEGDYTNAGLSLVGMVPGVGDAATATKLAAKGAKYAKNADKVVGAAQKGMNAGERAYEAYGAVQEAQGVVEGAADAYSELAKGNYGNAALALGQASLSVAGARDGAKAARGNGNARPDRSPDSDRAPTSGGQSATPDRGSSPPVSNGVRTAAGAGEKKDPLEARVLTRGSGNKPSPDRRGGSPIAMGGRNDESTRPATGRPSGRNDSTRPADGGLTGSGKGDGKPKAGSPSTSTDHPTNGGRDRQPALVGGGNQQKSADSGVNHDNPSRPIGSRERDNAPLAAEKHNGTSTRQQPDPSGAVSPRAGADQHSPASPTGGTGDQNSPQPLHTNQTSPDGSSPAPRTGGGSGDSGNGGLPPGPPSSSDQPSDNGGYNDLEKTLAERREMDIFGGRMEVSDGSLNLDKGYYIGQGQDRFYRPSVPELASAVEEARSARQGLVGGKNSEGTIAAVAGVDERIPNHGLNQRAMQLREPSEEFTKTLNDKGKISLEASDRDREDKQTQQTIPGSAQAGHAEQKALQAALQRDPNSEIISLGVDRLMCGAVNGQCFNFFPEAAKELKKTIVVAEMDQANNRTPSRSPYPKKDPNWRPPSESQMGNKPTTMNTFIFHPDGRVDSIPG